MRNLRDIHGRMIQLTDERLQHIETRHPEMLNQLDKITETLLEPDKIIRSIPDSTVELFHRFYDVTPVTSKFLCVVVKVLPHHNNFIITAYYTNTVRKGELLWKKI